MTVRLHAPFSHKVRFRQDLRTCTSARIHKGCKFRVARVPALDPTRGPINALSCFKDSKVVLMFVDIASQFDNSQFLSLHISGSTLLDETSIFEYYIARAKLSIVVVGTNKNEVRWICLHREPTGNDPGRLCHLTFVVSFV